MANIKEVESHSHLKELWILRGYSLMFLGLLTCGADPKLRVGLALAGIALTHHDYHKLTSSKS